ncbi:MAG: hypothetical protein WA869_34590, partial [Alloacidobacterium sp.]
SQFHQRAKRCLFIAFVAIGVIVGYFNFRFGLRGVFVMTNDEGLRTLIIIAGGYLSLLPLTLFGIWFRRASAILLIVGTVSACLAGLGYIEARSILFIAGHFVLPNVIVATLMWLSISRKVETSIARTDSLA